MKVFISWSGETSHKVAIALRDWLPSVLQGLEPYVSSEDIEKGARWSSEIGRQLDEISFGILCVTPDNLGSAWLNFEAGALSKSVETSRVSPFLLNLRPAELVGPISQFQAALPRADDILRLVKSINSVREYPLEEARLIDAVEMWWPRLEERLGDALNTPTTARPEPQRDTREMIEELLEITRELQNRVVRAGVGEQQWRANQSEEDREDPAEHERLRRAEIRAALGAILLGAGIADYLPIYISGNSVRLVTMDPISEETESQLYRLAAHHHFSLRVIRASEGRSSPGDLLPREDAQE